MPRTLTLAALLTIGLTTVRAQDDGFKPLFNGKDLAGWHNVNCAPGTFFVKDNMIITTGKPTGYLRTDKQYENFTAEFDWLHAPEKKRDKEITLKAGDLNVHEINVGNSGFFVWCDPIPAVGTGYTRGIEVQILVGLRATVAKTGKTAYTSQGDLFSIWGATCKPDRPHPLGWARCLPSEERTKGEHEWNHYKVIGNNGVLKLHVNGKEVSGVSECNPRKGYLALESEGSECRFRNLKIKELPSTNPKKDEICEMDKGWKCLFNGLDLEGWKASDEHKAHWKMSDGELRYDGKCAAKDPHLWTEKSYTDFELVVDWRFPGPGNAGIFLRGVRLLQPEPGLSNKIFLSTEAKSTEWDRQAVTVKGDRVTVRRKGRFTTDNVQIKGLAPDGPIGFEHADPVRFRNVFIRELKAGD